MNGKCTQTQLILEHVHSIFTMQGGHLTVPEFYIVSCSKIQKYRKISRSIIWQPDIMISFNLNEGEALEVDEKLISWFKKLVEFGLKNEFSVIRMIYKQDLDSSLRNEWLDEWGDELIWCLFKDSAFKTLGGHIFIPG